MSAAMLQIVFLIAPSKGFAYMLFKYEFVKFGNCVLRLQYESNHMTHSDMMKRK